MEVSEDGAHGALVRDIMDSKKSMEKETKNRHRSVISEADEQKTKKQTEQLQAEIQQISRISAPIGRILGTYDTNIF